MLAIFTIVFREFLEIALILGIVTAATRGLPERGQLMQFGLGLGIIGTLIIAMFTQQISQAMNGIGQEIFDACIIFAAVGLLSWTVLWMKRHAHRMAHNIHATSYAIRAGTQSLYVISLIVALATLREGTEIVLFSYGMLASGGASVSSVLVGGLLGASAGAAVGASLYFGLIKVAQKHLFTITSLALILLTAGMAQQGTRFLISADIMPAIVPMLWDSSQIISGSSFLGQVLGVLIGYSSRPSAMELLIYATVLLGLGYAYARIGKSQVNPTMQTA